MIKKGFSKAGRICVMLTIILLYTILANSLSAQAYSGSNPGPSPRTVTVGFVEIPGVSTMDAYGNMSGLMIDYLNEIAKYTNWNYQYIPTDSDNVIKDFLDGKFELMGGTYYSPDFEDMFSYPKYSMGSSRAILFCRKDNPDIKSYELSTLNGKTIGVYEKARDKTERLKKFLLINGLNCRLVYYSSEDVKNDGNLYRFLEQGDVDMLLGNEFESNDNFRITADFAAQPYYIVTHPGDDELLSGLNMGLEKALESDPSFPEDCYLNNYQSQSMTKISLTREDLSYAARKQSVTVAVVRNGHPFYCVENAADQHDGILPDLLEPLSEFSGLSFQYVFADTYSEAIQMVLDHKADLLGYYMETDEPAFEKGLALSKPYISLNNIILKNKASDFPAQGLTAAVMEGRALPRSIEADKILYYKTIHECLSAANTGEADYVYGLSTAIEQEMQKHRYTNLVPITSINNSTDICFAMDRPIDPSLMTILDKSIRSLSEDEKKSILDRNMISIGYSSLSLRELIDANPLAFSAIFSAFVLLAAGAVIGIMRVKVKNSLIENELEKAEAKSRAKGEFLSRMSHEIRTPMNAIMGLANLTCMEKDLPETVEGNLNKILSSSRYLLSLINDILDMSRIENGKMLLSSEEFSLKKLLGELENMMRVQAEEKHIHFLTELDLIHSGIVGDPIRLRQVLVNLVSNAIKFTPENGRVKLLVKEIPAREDAAEFLFSVQDTGIGIPADSLQRVFASFEQLGSSSAKSAGTGLGLPISYNIVQNMGGELMVESESGKGSDFHFSVQFKLCSVEDSSFDSPDDLTEEVDLSNINIILAEDNDLNAEIAMELLSMKGCRIDRAANGQEAVDLFSASAPGYYQAILMDIRMPVMDGLEATQVIRALSHPDALSIPIIAMTANSFKEDYDKAAESGMTGFIPKPVDVQYLFRVLKKSLEKSTPA